LRALWTFAHVCIAALPHAVPPVVVGCSFPHLVQRACFSPTWLLVRRLRRFVLAYRVTQLSFLLCVACTDYCVCAFYYAPRAFSRLRAFAFRASTVALHRCRVSPYLTYFCAAFIKTFLRFLRVTTFVAFCALRCVFVAAFSDQALRITPLQIVSCVFCCCICWFTSTRCGYVSFSTQVHGAFCRLRRTAAHYTSRVFTPLDATSFALLRCCSTFSFVPVSRLTHLNGCTRSRVLVYVSRSFRCVCRAFYRVFVAFVFFVALRFTFSRLAFVCFGRLDPHVYPTRFG